MTCWTVIYCLTWGYQWPVCCTVWCHLGRLTEQVVVVSVLWFVVSHHSGRSTEPTETAAQTPQVSHHRLHDVSDCSKNRLVVFVVVLVIVVEVLVVLVENVMSDWCLWWVSLKLWSFYFFVIVHICGWSCNGFCQCLVDGWWLRLKLWWFKMWWCMMVV